MNEVQEVSIESRQLTVNFRDKGDVFRENGDWSSAATSYREHLRLSADDFDIWVQLGHAEKESGRFAEALSAYNEAVALNGENADLLLNLGHLMKMQKRLFRAMEYYTRSFEIDCNDSARVELAALCSPIGNDADSRLAYNVFFGRDPEPNAPLEALNRLNDEALVIEFVSSAEFSTRLGQIIGNDDYRLSIFCIADTKDLKDTFVERLGGDVRALTSKLSSIEIYYELLKVQSFERLFHQTLGTEAYDLLMTHIKKQDFIHNREQHAKRSSEQLRMIGVPKTRTSYGNSVVTSFSSNSGVFDVDPKIIAFYLPQYHQVRENDEWWGKGFTEWTNVRKAVPNFEGHRQPKKPIDEKYYDLANVNTQVDQAKQAKDAGISAFCYYMYWFSGRRLLETPLDNMLTNPSVEMDFCICWANENWTRTWDGKEKDVLLGQDHSIENDSLFILDAIRYLADPRYLRVEGKLVVLVYRVDLMQNSREVARRWRDEVRKAGLGELHLCAVQFYGVTDPRAWGFDAAVEFPPHGWLQQENLVSPLPTLKNDQFSGHIFDYEKAIDFALRKPIPDYRWYRGVFPGWDNTARRQNTPHIFANDRPDLFQRWLMEVLRQQIIMAPAAHQIIFINAWNEWGEGAYLEPDEDDGHSKLRAVKAALGRAQKETEVLLALKRLRSLDQYTGRDFDELFLLNVLQGKERSLRFLMDELVRTNVGKLG